MLKLPEITSGTRVIVGMSGGVDSSTAALLLKEAGAEVIGMTMRTRKSGESRADASPVTSSEACVAAAAAAAQLGIPHHIIDVRQGFDRNVLQVSWDELAAGRTPNPCVRCNATIKFPELARIAAALGGGMLATGHYVRILRQPDGNCRILRGRNPAKDQSYFLYALAPELRQRLIFPLGDFTKEEVRAFAAARGLVSARRPESQDNCFAGSDGQETFGEALRQFLGAEAHTGNFRHVDGRILGAHGGMHRYTIGQRRGIGAFGPKPHCITAIDPQSGEIIVSDNPEDLLTTSCSASSCVWHDAPPTPGTRCLAQIRYRQIPVKTVVEESSGSTCRATFAEPLRAITPGQSLVLYDGDMIIGGGIINIKNRR